ncbi:MAG: OmpA family protein [Myxococcota bacterium]
MLRFWLTTIPLLFAFACGGAPAAESATAAESAEPSTEPAAATEETTASGEEFQLSSSDTAEQARGERPSEIEATETHAAMRLFVVNPDTGPIQGIVIKMTGPDGAVYYTRETDSVGYAEVLVPVGRRYDIEYLSLGRRNNTANVEVGSGPNQDIRLTMRYRRIDEPQTPASGDTAPRGLVLEGVLFDTNRATIKEESFPRLDRVVEYLTHRVSARVRISGHTDNVGNPRRNQRLSESRAEAVRDYLVEHGIDRSRIEAVGHGDQQPVASNDTEEGRQQNRRIEAVEL